jgi:hypothetical protein
MVPANKKTLATLLSHDLAIIGQTKSYRPSYPSMQCWIHV